MAVLGRAMPTTTGKYYVVQFDSPDDPSGVYSEIGRKSKGADGVIAKIDPKNERGKPYEIRFVRAPTPTPTPPRRRAVPRRAALRTRMHCCTCMHMHRCCRACKGILTRGMGVLSRDAATGVWATCTVLARANPHCSVVNRAVPNAGHR